MNSWRKFDMTGCEMAYHPAVDAIAVFVLPKIPDAPDTLIHAGKARTLLEQCNANVVHEAQLASRGYVQDDGTWKLPDMALLTQAG